MWKSVIGLVVMVGLVLGAGERWRPLFHFTPARNWSNDPNGLVYFEGEYHLFFQYNPFGMEGGHMSWGHAVSRDLVHWEELGVAIPEESGVMAFSGSAVVDWKNTSGWGKDGKPAMVAVYTGYRESDGGQFQCVAYSNDRGRTWVRVGKVLDIGSKAFRDPKVFWDEARGRWEMVVALSDERKVCFYVSKDLKSWERVGEFGPAGGVQGAWECPDLWEVKDDSGGMKWVLTVNVSDGAPSGAGSGQYFVGEFDGKTFKEEGRGWLDYGPDCYATVSWSGLAGGRRVVMGWMTNFKYAGVTPTEPWRGGMTMAREVRLVGGEVVQVPVKELEGLRGEHGKMLGSVEEVNGALRAWDGRGGGRDVEVEFEPTAGGRRFGMEIGGVVVEYDVERGELFVDRTGSGEIRFSGEFARIYQAKVPMRGGRVKLRVLVDASSVEVFADGGRVVMTELVYPLGDGMRLRVWGEGVVRGMEVWEMGAAR